MASGVKRAGPALPDRRAAARLLRLQAWLVGLVALAAWPLGAGLAALLGGLIALAGNGLAAWLALGEYRADRPHRMVGRFQLAEAVRIGFAAAAFAAVFAWIRPPGAAAVFVAFLVIQVGAPLLAHRAGRNED